MTEPGSTSIPQQLEIVPLEVLREHPRNPRQGNVDEIRRSIEVNGWYGAIVVQRSTRYILAGNHRYRAASDLGLPAVPVLWLDVDDPVALRVLLADNRTSDLATQEEECLRTLLAEILESTGSLAGTGYEPVDLDKLLGEVAAEESSPIGADQSDELRDRFQILIDCATEAEQRDLLERLGAEGYSCRALVA